MTGPDGAALDPPCTIEAGGAVYPMLAADGRSALAIYGPDEQFHCLYVLDGGVFRLDHCTRCVEGHPGERISVLTFAQIPCGHI